MADGASCQPAIAQRRMPCLDVEAAYLRQRWAGNGHAGACVPSGTDGRIQHGGVSVMSAAVAVLAGGYSLP